MASINYLVQLHFSSNVLKALEDVFSRILWMCFEILFLSHEIILQNSNDHLQCIPLLVFLYICFIFCFIIVLLKYKANEQTQINQYSGIWFSHFDSFQRTFYLFFSSNDSKFR